MRWQELVKQKSFITVLCDVDIEQEESPICRYAVWTPGNDMMGHRIAEVGNNLQLLKEKYGIADDQVLELP